VAVSVALRVRDGGAACEVGDDVAFTLRASSGGGDKPHVMAPIAFPANLSGTQCASTENLAPAMGAKNPTAVASAMQVRRLTPRECERLQGFPDSYTEIPWRKKPASECPDGPRYKALGNSMAVPVMRWIGARIARQVTP
jgi:DNA (cytosine-5)-methyltransferase 1